MPAVLRLGAMLVASLILPGCVAERSAVSQTSSSEAYFVKLPRDVYDKLLVVDILAANRTVRYEMTATDTAKSNECVNILKNDVNVAQAPAVIVMWNRTGLVMFEDRDLVPGQELVFEFSLPEDPPVAIYFNVLCGPKIHSREFSAKSWWLSGHANHPRAGDVGNLSVPSSGNQIPILFPPGVTEIVVPYDLPNGTLWIPSGSAFVPGSIDFHGDEILPADLYFYEPNRDPDSDDWNHHLHFDRLDVEHTFQDYFTSMPGTYWIRAARTAPAGLQTEWTINNDLVEIAPWASEVGFAYPFKDYVGESLTFRR